METQTISFHSATDTPPIFIPPEAKSIFANRAARLEALAPSHALADYLRFIARLTVAQHEALLTLGEFALPEDAVIAQATAHGMPALNASVVPRPAIWREIVVRLARAVAPHAPTSHRAAFEALGATPAERLEQMADDLLTGAPAPGDLAQLPIVAAALQVVWTARASRFKAGELRPLDPPGVCPCCGSLPVASVLRVSPSINNLRYLHCSLCNSEWNVSRAICTACSSDEGLHFRQIEGHHPAVRAECCDHCKSYLKLFVQEKDLNLDPVADDLATLALDLLVDEAGYSRSGPNLLLIGAAA